MQIADSRCEGLIVTPGFVDLHVHLREPGFEYKEDITTGCMAAVAGGFTTIFCMPNTKPANDNTATNSYILKRSAETALCTVYPVGAISKELKGESLSNIDGLARAGVIAISDDGACVQNEQLMKEAMQRAARLDLLVITIRKITVLTTAVA
jgi:dihydroorotase